MMTETLITAASLFVIIKVLFSFVGWFISDEGDSFVRQQLDVYWERLENYSLSDLVHQTLTNLVFRVRETVRKTKHAVLKLLALAFAINFISVALTFPLVEIGLSFSSKNYISTALLLLVDIENSPEIIPQMTAMLIGLAFMGMVFDIFSVYVTWFLIRRAAAFKSLISAFSHLAIDVVVAIAACFWVMLIYTFYLVMVDEGFTDTFDKIDFILNHTLDVTLEITKEILSGDLIQYLFLEKGNEMYLATVIVGISAAIPTLAYTILVALSIIAHLTPRWFHQFLSRCIFLVTTEDTPVFARMGTILGGAAAITGAIAKL